MMNDNEFKSKLEKNKELIDRMAESYFDEQYRLAIPMTYSLDSGKRMRANLYLETLRMFGIEISDEDLNFALALEMIHAYSLVHDDLPAMDNDDMRRGKPSSHKKFGEDIAILTGDSLLTEASFLLTKISLSDNKYLRPANYLLEKSGYKGMVEGQVLDLHRPKQVNLGYLLKVYDLKTVNLFLATTMSAGMLANLDEISLSYLENYTYYLGLSFQIQDDLLESDYEDELNILNVMSKKEAEDLLSEYNNKANDAIRKLENHDFHAYLIDYLTKRTA